MEEFTFHIDSLPFQLLGKSKYKYYSFSNTQKMRRLRDILELMDREYFNDVEDVVFW